MQIYDPHTNRPSPRTALLAARSDDEDIARGLAPIFATALLGLVMALAAISGLAEGQRAGGAVLALGAVIAGHATVRFVRDLPPQRDDER